VVVVEVSGILTGLRIPRDALEAFMAATSDRRERALELADAIETALWGDETAAAWASTIRELVL
jgi:hypothetical protein